MDRPFEFQWNLNQSIRFQITKHGREHHKAWHREHYGKYSLDKDGNYEYRPLKEDKDGWVSMQCWSFMECFGPVMGLGMEQPCGMNVFLEDRAYSELVQENEKLKKELEHAKWTIREFVNK